MSPRPRGIRRERALCRHLITGRVDIAILIILVLLYGDTQFHRERRSYHLKHQHYNRRRRCRHHLLLMVSSLLYVSHMFVPRVLSILVFRVVLLWNW